MDHETGGQRPGPQLLTVAELASMLRVSKMTVYRLVHSGELAAIRVGGSFRVPRHAAAVLLGDGHDALCSA
jgi:excisionase family DNA binding protein